MWQLLLLLGELWLRGRFGRGFVKGVVTYMVMDNLVVKPMSTISGIITLLKQFNFKDVGALAEKIIHLDKSMVILITSFSIALPFFLLLQLVSF